MSRALRNASFSIKGYLQEESMRGSIVTILVATALLSACAGSSAERGYGAPLQPKSSAATLAASPGPSQGYASGYDYDVGATPAGSGSPVGATTAGTMVKIVDFGFDAAAVTLKAGATVMWTNTGKTTHIVTPDDSSFDSKPVAPGATVSVTLGKPGTYRYHCSIHPSMHGTVVVQ